MEKPIWSSDRGDLVQKIYREYSKGMEKKGEFTICVSDLEAEVERENFEDEMLAKKAKENEQEQENLF